MSAMRFLRGLADLRLTIFCLALLMVQVALCTLAQVEMGVFAAVDKYMRSMFLWAEVPGLHARVPVFPGGGTAGFLLLLNLAAAFVFQFRPNRRLFGIWLIHLGLILFVLAEFVTGMCAVETRMVIAEGQTKRYTESPTDIELAVVETTSPAHDEVTSIPGNWLKRSAAIAIPGLPFTLTVKRYFENAALANKAPDAPMAIHLATQGAGASISVFPKEPVTADDERNLTTVFVELRDADKSLGVWLLSVALDSPESVECGGRTFRIELRPERYYLPFEITLNDFQFDRYAGTEIPKNFSSRVHLRDTAKSEDRDVLIYMNHPLRYGGKAFYQASFAKDETVSILQVVENPGWLLPYAGFGIVSAGLLAQFLMHLFGFSRKVSAGDAVAPGAGPH